jgi:hypothetical protein
MRTIAGLCCLLAVTTATADEPISGLRPGDQVSAWEPIHVAGPHAGTKTCPVCTYLDAPVLRVGCGFAPIPFAPELERALLPGSADLVRAARQLMGLAG